MRQRLALFFWCVVALFLFLAPLLLILSAGSAQDAGAPPGTLISAPEDMANPTTGEAGTWIPRWVERESVLTEHKLQMCLKDVELADQDILAMEDRSAALEATVADLEHAKDELLVETYSLEQTQAHAARALARRLRAVWGLVGGLVTLGATTAVLSLR
jgi:hypothetical protein